MFHYDFQYGDGGGGCDGGVVDIGSDDADAGDLCGDVAVMVSCVDVGGGWLRCVVIGWLLLSPERDGAR